MADVSSRQDPERLRAARPDPYGHGTHVASVAAGAAPYQAPDTTGIAPNADLYDVKVLDDNGIGTLSDALEGIEWVIYHAKEYNIRVLNLSLATDSTETWQTDPLCAAVRSAAAAGITVVVAAGNFGQDAAGEEVYGRIGSPGTRPVGHHGGRGQPARHRRARSDDSVNGFSSRGPTRGAYIDASGVRSRSTTCSSPIWWRRATSSIGAASTAARPGAADVEHLAAHTTTTLVGAAGHRADARTRRR